MALGHRPCTGLSLAGLSSWFWRDVVTCLSSFSIADITIRPRHTMGATSSTRKPMDMLPGRRSGVNTTAHSHTYTFTLLDIVSWLTRESRSWWAGPSGCLQNTLKHTHTCQCESQTVIFQACGHVTLTVGELRVSLQVHQFGDGGAVDVSVQQTDGLWLGEEDVEQRWESGSKCPEVKHRLEGTVIMADLLYSDSDLFRNMYSICS